MAHNSSQPLASWTSSPNSRGTSDILSNSCLTLILCTWTVLCLNVFPSTYGRRKRAFRKSLMAGLTFIGPEFIFQLAFGQWCSACQSVKTFRQSGYQGWSMKHAFLANMGGFVLHPRLSATEHWHTFPLDAEQVHYLVRRGYIPYSAVLIDSEVIEDKNKVDGLLRLLTVCQILWYFVGTVGRAFQGLTISLLELSTLGFIVCSLGTYFCWFHKPMDIGRPFILEANATLPEILLQASNPTASAIRQELLSGETDISQQTYNLTPLEFIGLREWSMTLCWDYGMRIFKKLGLSLFARKRPITKIPDDYYPELPIDKMWVNFVVHTGYAAIHIIGWNFYFATGVERTLWRVTNLGILSSIISFWIIHLCWWVLPTIMAPRESQAPRRISKVSTAESLNDKVPSRHPPNLVTRLRCVVTGLRSHFSEPDPAKGIPLIALVPVIICAVVYVISRAYVTLESFISLRALPSDAYQTVDWTVWLPHL